MVEDPNESDPLDAAHHAIRGVLPQWSAVVNTVKPHVVRILTPEGFGTGFLFVRAGGLVGVATAAHVVNDAFEWEKPIRLFHDDSGKSVMLRVGQGRAIIPDQKSDSAVIVFPEDQLPLPAETLQMWEEDKSLKVGNPIGWLGFPAVAANHLCFFRGSISFYEEDTSTYLVDGVAINGVSGGPAFWAVGGTPFVIGLVTQYIPNYRPRGEAFPGLSRLADLTYFYDMVKRFRSMDDAKETETEEQRQAQAAPEPQTEPPSESEPSEPRRSGEPGEPEPPGGGATSARPARGRL